MKTRAHCGGNELQSAKTPKREESLMETTTQTKTKKNPKALIP